MSFENNPLKNKSELEKQLEGNYETSDLKEKIDILKEEINYLEGTLETIKEFGDEDPEGIEDLKNKTLADKQRLQEKLEKFQKELQESQEK